MNEETLYRMRRPPRPEFARTLHARLSSLEELEPSSYLGLGGFGRFIRRLTPPRLVTLSIILLLFTACTTAIASPTVRATVQNLLDRNWTRIYIGDMTFSQGSLTSKTSGGLTVGTSERMTVAETQALLPSLRLPTWVPAGFELEELAWVNRDDPAAISTLIATLEPMGAVEFHFPFAITATLTWTGATDEEIISLQVIQLKPSETWKEIVWEVQWQGRLEEIEIRSQPAAFAREKGYNNPAIADRREDWALTITWIQSDGVRYALWAPEAFVGREELIRMAESVPENEKQPLPRGRGAGLPILISQPR